MHFDTIDPTWDIVRSMFLGCTANLGVLRDYLYDHQPSDLLTASLPCLVGSNFETMRNEVDCPVLPEIARSLVVRAFPHLPYVLEGAGLETACITILGEDRRAAIEFTPDWMETPLRIPLTLLGGADVTPERIAEALDALRELRGTIGIGDDDVFQNVVLDLPNATSPTDVHALTAAILAWGGAFADSDVFRGSGLNLLNPAIAAVREEPNSWELILHLAARLEDTDFGTQGVDEPLLPGLIGTFKGRLTPQVIDDIIRESRLALDLANEAGVHDFTFRETLLATVRVLGTNAEPHDIAKVARLLIGHVQEYGDDPRGPCTAYSHPANLWAVMRSFRGMADPPMTLETVEAVLSATRMVAAEAAPGEWRGAAALLSALEANPRNRSIEGVEACARAVLEFERATKPFDSGLEHAGRRKTHFVEGAIRSFGDGATPEAIVGLIPVYRAIAEAATELNPELVSILDFALLPHNAHDETRYAPDVFARCVTLAVETARHISGGELLCEDQVIRNLGRALGLALDDSALNTLSSMLDRSIDELGRLSPSQQNAYSYLLTNALRDLPPSRATLSQIGEIFERVTTLAQDMRRGISPIHPLLGIAAEHLRHGIEKLLEPRYTEEGARWYHEDTHALAHAAAVITASVMVID